MSEEPEEQEETEEQHLERCKNTYMAILIRDRDAVMQDCGSLLMALANIGWDAALLYDDNGHWAMPDGGSSSMSEEPADWEGYYHAKKENWHDSPREAILHAVREHAKDLGVEA
jgi:hypothetical protein